MRTPLTIVTILLLASCDSSSNFQAHNPPSETSETRAENAGGTGHDRSETYVKLRVSVARFIQLRRTLDDAGVPMATRRDATSFAYRDLAANTRAAGLGLMMLDLLRSATQDEFEGAARVYFLSIRSWREITNLYLASGPIDSAVTEWSTEFLETLAEIEEALQPYQAK